MFGCVHCMSNKKHIFSYIVGAIGHLLLDKLQPRPCHKSSMLMTEEWNKDINSYIHLIHYQINFKLVEKIDETFCSYGRISHSCLVHIKLTNQRNFNFYHKSHHIMHWPMHRVLHHQILHGISSSKLPWNLSHCLGITTLKFSTTTAKTLSLVLEGRFLSDSTCLASIVLHEQNI